jgi:DNA repair protein RadC
MKTLLEALPLRERPAWRVAYQADSCNLIELLAALIGGAQQIETAQALLGRFDSPKTLANATCDEIATVEGLGPATAAKVRAALELGRRFSASIEDNRPSINTPEDAAALLLYSMQDYDQEHLMVLLLDTRNRLIGEPVEIYHGSLNTSLVRVGEIFRPAIRANAASIIVAHNHPSGDPSPSPEDVAITKAVVRAGEMLDIECLDHLIICRGRFLSLKSKGLGFN